MVRPDETYRQTGQRTGGRQTDGRGGMKQIGTALLALSRPWVLRQRVFPNARLSGAANLLVYPNLEAANGAFNLLKAAGDGLAVGPLLVGAAKPVHIVTPSISARGLVNMSALAVVDSQSREGQKPLL